MILLKVFKKNKPSNIHSSLLTKLKKLTNSKLSEIGLRESVHFKKNKPKQDLISYIITIKLSQSNTFINVTDTNGKLKLFLSSGLLGLTGKQKKLQPLALITLLKSLLIKGKFALAKPVAIHFKNSKSFHEFIVINLLKKFFFIKSIRSYNLQPHNGCRPKKLRRIKNRTKK